MPNPLINPSISLIAAVSSKCHLYYSISQGNTNKENFSSFMYYLAFKLELNSPNWWKKYNCNFWWEKLPYQYQIEKSNAKNGIDHFFRTSIVWYCHIWASVCSIKEWWFKPIKRKNEHKVRHFLFINFKKIFS